jgi:Tetratricopeptide repeat
MTARMRVIALLLVTALGGLAHADTKMTAKEHYKKGLSLFALGKYGDAAVEYEAAFELEPDPALLYNAAQAHRLAGNKQRALTLYQSFVRMFPKSDDGSVTRHIASLKAAIEAEGKIAHAPPTDTRAPVDRVGHEPTTTTTSPTTTTTTSPTTTTTTAPTTTTTTNTLVTTPPPPKKKGVPKWVWGVVAGVAVVGIGLGVGLGVGLSGNSYPSPTGGSGQIP